MYLLFIKRIKKITLLNLAICLLFSNCSLSSKKQPVKTVDDKDIKEISFIDNISKSQKINLSTIVSGIDYCILETDEKCLITPSMSIHCSKDHVVAMGTPPGERDVIYVFDRKTGMFLRQISRNGQGPDEYISVDRDFWDEKREQVRASGGVYSIFFNMDGTISHKINRSEHPFYAGAIAFDNYYVAYVPNRFGNQTKRIAFLDRNGDLIDSIPNTRTWERINQVYSGMTFGHFHVFRDELFYTDIFCDTLYQIKDFKLLPRYVFNSGLHTLPYQEHNEGGRYNFRAAFRGETLVDRWEKYFVLDKILEDSKNLYFTFDYGSKRFSAIYSKKEEILQILPPAPIPLPSRDDTGIPLYGFDNDIDGGLPFWPQEMISENEMMCIYTAEELLALDVSKITDPKLKNVLNSLEEDSNPVVAIGTVKNTR